MTESTLSNKLQTVRAAQKVDAPDRSVLKLLQDDQIRIQLTRALPRSLSADRFMRILLTEVRQNPKLLECTRESFMGCVMDMAQLGLSPGPLGHAYLVPFRDSKKGTTECTLILGYKGLIDLARRSKEIASLKARTVYANDRLRYSEGLVDVLEHEPAEGDRGEPVRFYAVATFVNGGHAMRVMTKADVEKIRSRSRSKNEGPWVTDYEAMAQKTVIRQLANRGELPLTIEAAEAISLDEARDLGLQQPAGLDLTPPEIDSAEPTSGSMTDQAAEGKTDRQLPLVATVRQPKADQQPVDQPAEVSAPAEYSATRRS